MVDYAQVLGSGPVEKERLQERGRIAVWHLRRWADTAQRPGSIPWGGKKWEVSIRWLLLYFLKEVCVKPSVECLHSWWLLYQLVEATVERERLSRQERRCCDMSPATFSGNCRIPGAVVYRITTYRNVLKILRIQLNAFHTLLWPAPMYLITFYFCGEGE